MYRSKRKSSQHLTVIHFLKMVLPTGGISIFVDRKFHYYKHVNFLKINFKLTAISIKIPSGFFKLDKFILSESEAKIA